MNSKGKCEVSAGKFVIDSNAVLYYLDRNSCLQNYYDKEFIVSVISEIELLGYSDITADEEVAVNNFLKDCEILNITDEIKQTTISLRKKYRIKLPDAIIAATAICCSVPLLSADVVFNRIDEIDFIQLMPYDCE